MSESASARPIKVGVITDQTGALSFMGIANANVAKMVIDDINANGGLLGRTIELCLEDSETTDSAAEAKATKLVQQDHVDVILGGIYSSTRQAIKGPAVVEGKKLYIYPEQYEGQECDPLIFCTGPVPAQQVEPLIPWLMQQTGAKKFYLPSADYIWPRTLNNKVREVVTANGGAIVGEEYFPLDHTDYAETVDKITTSGAEVVFNTIVPPGLTPFLELLYDSGFTTRGGSLVCTYFDENFLNLVPAAHGRGPVQLPRLLPGHQRSVQRGADPGVRQAVSGRRQVHRRERVFRHVPRPEALGSRRERGRLARSRRRQHGA
jgi:ABC-type branched-subunit amino acid transport system substrate-binding protein